MSSIDNEICLVLHRRLYSTKDDFPGFVGYSEYKTFGTTQQLLLLCYLLVTGTVQIQSGHGAMTLHQRHLQEWDRFLQLR